MDWMSWKYVTSQRNCRVASVCVCVCMDGLGVLRRGAPRPCFSDNMWSGFAWWRIIGWLCLTECHQMDSRKWLWEVGKVSEREEGRVNAMRSGTLKKKIFKEIFKDFFVLSVKWLLLLSSQKPFVKSDFWGG